MEGVETSVEGLARTGADALDIFTEGQKPVPCDVSLRYGAMRVRPHKQLQGDAITWVQTKVAVRLVVLDALEPRG